VGVADTKGKTNLDLMKEVIAKEAPKTDLKDKSEVYIQARFDGISEDIASRGERRSQLDGKFLPKNDTRNDSDFDSETAKAKSHADAKDGWKQPLAASKK